MKRMVCFGLGATLLSAALAPALADWNVGDSHKMHFPQLPDRYGMDVNFRSPIILADDWTCSGTGPVTDIHFWFSAIDDWFSPTAPLDNQIYNIHTSIHGNIPANPVDPTSYSKPADPPLWQRDFNPTAPEVKIRPWTPDGLQGWFDPTIPSYMPNNHQRIYQVNIRNIPNPFYQQYGTVYWLDLSISSLLPLGWKTADTSLYPPPYTGNHYLDDAVFWVPGTNDWRPLVDPRFPTDHVSLDLSFVITPEPTALGLMALPAVVLLRRRG
jgi:hypothetical protein